MSNEFILLKNIGMREIAYKVATFVAKLSFLGGRKIYLKWPSLEERLLQPTFDGVVMPWKDQYMVSVDSVWR